MASQNRQSWTLNLFY